MSFSVHTSHFDPSRNIEMPVQPAEPKTLPRRPSEHFTTVQGFSGRNQGPEWGAVSLSSSQEYTMTAIITDAPIANCPLKLPRLRFPKFGIGVLLAATPSSLGSAFTMAYLDPYASPRRHPEVLPNEDLDGRAASW
jgi:hypothetical protein